MAKHATPHRTAQAGTAVLIPVVASSASAFTGRVRGGTQDRTGRHSRD